jgi:hypothetical protein
MLFHTHASEIPQFVVVLAIAIALGGVAVYAILTNTSGQATNIASFISGINVPAAP